MTQQKNTQKFTVYIDGKFFSDNFITEQPNGSFIGDTYYFDERARMLKSGANPTGGASRLQKRSYIEMSAEAVRQQIEVWHVGNFPGQNVKYTENGAAEAD